MTKPKKRKRQYLNSDSEKLIRALANKSYYKRLLPVLKKELSHMDALLRIQQEEFREKAYNGLNEGIRNIISPLYPDQEYLLRKWEEMPYEKKEADSHHKIRTMKGDMVTSKSERLIANSLYQRGIPYRYEQALLLPGYDKPIHPDFTILCLRDRAIRYWEHLGMMDSESYAEGVSWRLGLYEKNRIFPGEKLILTFEDKKYPLQEDTVISFIERYCL